jgi:hypothetical protein
VCSTEIGGGDLKDVLRDSLNQFVRVIDGEERVGARGIMRCESNVFFGPDAPMEWSIYANPW